MNHIFISHVEEDADIALEIALKLEKAGYTTWFYELDSLPGPSYLLQTGAAIEQSLAVILVISPNSLGSQQVTREVVRAHESSKYVIPLLRDISHVEFQNRQPEWREALGSATSTLIPQEGISGIFDRIVNGLKAKDIHPTSKPDVSRLERIRRMLIETPSSGVMKEGIKPDLPAYDLPKPKAIGGVGVNWLNKLRGRWVWVIVSVFIIIIAVIGSWLYFNMSGEEAEDGEAATELSLNHIGTYSTSREANNVYVVDDIAYVANSGDGLLVLDVSTPSEPKKIGQYPLENPENEAKNVVIAGNIAYLVERGGRDRLVLLDIGIPSNPIKVGEYEHDTYHSLDKIAVVDNTVYLTASGNLFLLDVSVPSNPVKLGECEFDSNVVNPGVVVADNVAYVLANDFHMIDVRNPSEPVQIGQFDTSDWGSGIALVGKTAYVVGWSSGLEIIDVSVPSQPIKIGRYIPVGPHELIPPGATGRLTVIDISVTGDIAYVTYSFGIDHGTWTETLESGIIVIDISDPENPVKIADYSAMEEVSSVFAVGDIVFSTDTTRGVYIFSLGEPSADH
jgi:hypothetical protein